MNAILDVLSGPAWRHLTIALLHTLWQGPAAAAMLWVALRWIPARRSDARYAAAFAALIGVVVAGLATWSVLDLERPSYGAGVLPAQGSQPLANATRAGMPDPQRSVQPTPTQSVGASGFPRGAWEPGNNRAWEPGKNITGPWLAWLTVFWLLGVGLTAGRTAWGVIRLRRIARGPEVADPRIRQWADELCRLFHVRRALRIVEAAEDFGPAVFGVVRPVLVLPVSMLTGLPPEAVRAVLAHELAHLRRHDYWFNLVQMAVEAVLFFNPAVWWISRQVRTEREASCDALAALALGHPAALAEALLAWAERRAAQRGRSHFRGDGAFSHNNDPRAAKIGTVPGEAALAFSASGRRGPGLLLDRVRRLLIPGYRPQLSISPLGLLGTFVGGAAVLIGLFYGTSAAVELAARILTPQERIEKVEETRREYVSQEPKLLSDNPDDMINQVVLKGTVRTRDGKPLPIRMTFVTSTRDWKGNSYVKAEDANLRSFSITARSGTTWLFVTNDGYAPAIIGPLVGKPGKTIADIEIVLEKGEPRIVRIDDEQGKPIRGVAVNVRQMHGSNDFHLETVRTDDNGDFIVRINPRTASSRYSFSMSKPGFQTCTRTNIELRADSPTVVVLPSAKPLAGELLSPDGSPVAGAIIRQYMKSSLAGGSFLNQAGPVLAVSDAKGQFTLDTLEDAASYFLVAESAEYGRAAIRFDTPRTERLSVKYGLLLTVSGVIRGPLDKLIKTDGKPSIYFSQPISLKHCSTSWHGNAIVETIDGRQRFTIRGLLPGEVSITAGWADSQRYVRMKVDAAKPHREVTIDLTRPIPPPVKRPVVLRLTAPDGATPKGAIRVRVLPADGPYSERDDRTVPLENGVARVDAYVSGSIFYSPRGLIGYWFPWENASRKVEPGKEPLEIDVPVTPAGAIAGRVIDADGKPVGDKVSVNMIGRKMDETNGSVYQHGDFGGGNIRVDRQGKFWINPLPLDWKYAIDVSRGHTVCCSGPIELNGAKPTAEATFSLPRTTAAEGKVLDPDGRPLAVPLELSFRSNTKNLDGGFSSKGWSDTQSNHQGSFRFDDLGVGVGEYFLYLKPRKDYQPSRVPLSLDGRPVEVRLKPGFVLEGTVLDDATGKPAAGLQIFTQPANLKSDSMRREAELPTDDRGRFRFSNLGDEAYKIGIQGGPQLVVPKGSDGVTWKPGDLTVIELRVKIPVWFRPGE